MTLSKNEIARQLLLAAGFSLEAEPSWVTKGEKPDFFCTGPVELWVEVKAIGEPERFERLGANFDSLRDRAKSVSGHGRAHAWVADDATERDLKAAISLAKDALRLREASSERPDRIGVVVPRKPVLGRRVKITVETDKQRQQLLCAASLDHRYGRPSSWGDLTLRSRARIEEDGRTREVDPFELDLEEDNFLVCLELERGEKPFYISTCAPIGAANRLTTNETIRLAAKKANSQFKNACKFRAAPCLLMVFEDGVFVQKVMAFASAFYGNLQYTASTKNFDDGRLGFGPDGFWRPNRNRTMSSAGLIRNDGQPVLIPNPWAELPLPDGVFGWEAVRIGEDGTIEFPP